MVKKTESILLIIAMMFITGCTSESVVLPDTEESLGERLFFDPVLSRDSSVSCASCHKPEHAFADNVKFSVGVHQRRGTRNTPSAMNQTGRNFYFWDGRAETLEEQALGPMENHDEMDFPLTLTVRRLLRNTFYRNAFYRVYNQPPSKALLARAIAAFEESLETSESPFDKYMNGSDSSLFPESAKRGLSIFNGKGKCFDCHFGVDFSGNDDFKNIGLYDGSDSSDKGRYLITGQKKDLGAFKVPGLRNVALTAPYMHDGRFATLEQVIDFYDDPEAFVKGAVNRDSLLRKPLYLSASEKADLLSFLNSLTDERFRAN